MSRVIEMTIANLNDNVYAFQGEFSNEQIANLFRKIIARLNVGGTLKRQCYAGAINRDYVVKVLNSKNGSFISLTNDEETAVSRHLGEMLDISREVNEDDINTLLEMFDEAYVLLNY